MAIVGTLLLLAEVATAVKTVNEGLQEEIALPNTPRKVTDWFVWNTIKECNGWRIQQNTFTRHCRLVDPDDWRRAWGTKNGMMAVWKELEDKM